jgi:hypothetical protein
VAALLRGKSVRVAAEEVGIARRTLVTWMTEDWFRSQYEAAKRELLEATINMLRTAGETGVNTLTEVAKSRKAPPTARASAGRALLEVLLRAVEVQDLAGRIERLEAALKEERTNEG